MPNLNQVNLIGILTRDPEMKYTQSGTAITEVGLAVNRNWTTDSGEKRTEATFIDITLFGRMAEIAGQYLKKGQPAYFGGRIHMDTWDDKQTGAKRTKLKVVAESLQLLAGKPQGAASAPPAPTRPHPEPTSKPAAKRDPDLDAEPDDIPF